MAPPRSPDGAPIYITWHRQGVTVYMDGTRFYDTPENPGRTRRHA